MIRTSALRRSDVSTPRLMYSRIAGMIGPSAVITMAIGSLFWACTGCQASNSALRKMNRIEIRFIRNIINRKPNARLSVAENACDPEKAKIAIGGGETLDTYAMAR